MQIRSEELLRHLKVYENAGQVAFFDIETSGLNADYQSMVIGTVKPYKGKPVTFVAKRMGQDKKIVKDMVEEMGKYLIWVGQYSKRFDIPYLQACCVHHNLPPVPSHHHIDIWQSIRFKLKISSKSQGHMARFLGTVDKMPLPTDTWRELYSDPKNIKLLVERCESDCSGLEEIYDRVKHLFRDVTR